MMVTARQHAAPFILKTDSEADMYSLKFMHGLHSDSGHTMYHCNSYAVRPAPDGRSFNVAFPAEPESGLRELTVIVGGDPDRDYAELYVMNDGGKTIERVAPQQDPG